MNDAHPETITNRGPAMATISENQDSIGAASPSAVSSPNRIGPDLLHSIDHGIAWPEAGRFEAGRLSRDIRRGCSRLARLICMAGVAWASITGAGDWGLSSAALADDANEAAAYVGESLIISDSSAPLSSSFDEGLENRFTDLDSRQLGSGLDSSGLDGWSEQPLSVARAVDAADYYHWEFLPRESLYPFYLADTKASRLAGQILDATNDGTLLDATLGGRFGIFRYVNGTQGIFRRGIQADFEGAAQVRLDTDNEYDVRSVDFRAGVPISLSFGRFQTRFGYYHLSSHLGDEFMIRNPTFERLNYSRDVLFIAAAYWLDESTRVYGEAGWAFYSDVSEPWEFLFGIEEAPRYATGVRGAPFYAIHGRLREEVDFGGSVTVQIGWAWRSAYDTGLLRTGFQYFNGKSNQFSFTDFHEEMFGVGLWYDF
ncbi:DUF1207 domain-containing protein [Planctomycetaceae bacterium SH139]